MAHGIVDHIDEAGQNAKTETGPEEAKRAGPMTLWVVRSGKYGERESLALDNGLAVIGWDNLSDLSALSNREALYAALEAAFPDEKRKTLSNWESQLWPFAHMMAKGDLVVMPLKTRAAIAIGKVAGPYVFRSDIGDARHTRQVVG